MNNINIIVKRSSDSSKKVEVGKGITFIHLKSNIIATWNLPPIGSQGQNMRYHFVNDKTGELISNENQEITEVLNNGDLLLLVHVNSDTPKNVPSRTENRSVPEVSAIAKPNPISQHPLFNKTSLPHQIITTKDSISKPVQKLPNNLVSRTKIFFEQNQAINTQQFNITGIALKGFNPRAKYPVLAMGNFYFDGSRKIYYLVANDTKDFCWLSLSTCKFKIS